MTLREAKRAAAYVAIPVVGVGTFAMVRVLCGQTDDLTVAEAWVGGVAFVVWLVASAFIEQAERAMAVKCRECGGCLRHITHLDTRTSTVGRCDRCGRAFRLEKINS